jgi:hypothetical protein
MSTIAASLALPADLPSVTQDWVTYTAEQHAVWALL